FSHPEGYVERKTSGSYNYAYQYKDHLGNIRLTYMDNNGSLDIIEEHNYYPFGLKHKGYNDVVSANANSIAQKFKYNGIELEESLGVDWYEMDVRQYDPAVARFTSIDPVIHYDFSTYNAFDNNPVFWADPSGANAGCPSCQTEEDWENYYSQAENTAMMVGDESAYDGFGRVTSMLDENGNSLVYLDGELQDLVVYDNWLDAVSSTISDGLLIEAPLLLGKVISNVFKSGGDEAVEAVVKADNLSVSEQVVAEAKRVNPNANTTTLTPGENVGSSIPARSKSQTFTKAERTKINEIGSAEGCHTCGTTNSGRTSGNFTPDHQPPSSLVPNGTSQRLYPHCAGCSASQGGTVSSLRRKGYNIFNIDNNLHN
ncbi:RHS repeat-associated core domain-containing protein, partial [Winogradskyella sp.]|uniref:RHS repeat domain-containing protein n=1 Tax=Winogradskyella sp. TaxID=1883156 RepID=UPI0026171BD0